MGGALAQMCARHLAQLIVTDRNCAKKKRYPKQKLCVVSFGSPCVGNEVSLALSVSLTLSVSHGLWWLGEVFADGGWVRCLLGAWIEKLPKYGDWCLRTVNN